MKETDKSRKDLIKLALVPVLLVVLAAILFWPASTPEAITTVAHPTAVPVKMSVAADEPVIASSQTGRWPSLDLSQVTSVNPFAKSRPIQEMLGELPEESPIADGPVEAPEPLLASEAAGPQDPPTSPADEAPAQPEREVIDVAAVATLQAIIESRHGRCALINSRIFRVGDLLDGAYRIVEISPTAVSVEWIALKENGESQ